MNIIQLEPTFLSPGHINRLISFLFHDLGYILLNYIRQKEYFPSKYLRNSTTYQP